MSKFNANNGWELIGAGIITVVLWVGLVLLLAQVPSCAPALASEIPLESPQKAITGINWDKWIPDTRERENILLSAIWHSEGGSATNYPFGIKSIKCEGYYACRRIARNTIHNNISRFRVNRENGINSYLEFLGSRYCPVTDKTDKDDLCNYWVTNVTWLLQHPKEIDYEGN